MVEIIVYRIDVVVNRNWILVNTNFKMGIDLNGSAKHTLEVKVLDIFFNEVDFNANHVRNRNVLVIYKKQKEEVYLLEVEAVENIVLAIYLSIILVPSV